MKTLITPILSVISIFLICSCQKEELSQPDSKPQTAPTELHLDENGESYQHLKLDLSGLAFVKIYPLDQKNQMLEDIADFILEEDAISKPDAGIVLPESGRISVKMIQHDGISRGAYQVAILDNLPTEEGTGPLEAPCGSNSKTCCSKGCVIDLIESIYEADRDVDVGYRSSSFCRKITWEYQDC